MGAFRLASILIDPSRNIIANGAGSWSLEPKVMDLLAMLAAHPGEVLSRETLIDQVWKVEYGADESLTRAVSLLRKAFRDAGHAGELIETIPKRGYRLTVAPEPVTASPAAAATPPPEIPASVVPSSKPVDHPATISGPAIPQDASPGASGRAQLKPRTRVGLLAAVAAAFVLAAVVLVGTLTRWGAPALERSIAVLPFANETVDVERAYLGRVIPGEIIEILSQLKGVDVIARNSSFTFDADTDVLEVGAKLGVAHVLSGTVREEGENINVSTTLADAKTGHVIWTRSETTRFAPEKVPVLQKDIAERVAGAMSIAFNVPASSRLTGGSTRNFEAYDNYMRGLSYWWDGGPARDAFAKATALDPDYAEAWAGQAVAAASDTLRIIDPAKAREDQKAAYAMAERGVKIAPELAVTQACYGALSTTQGKWIQAEIATSKAMEISRGEMSMNHRQNTLARVGRSMEAYELMLEQKATDPFVNFGAFRNLGVLPATGRQDELMDIATSYNWFGSKTTVTLIYGLMARIHAGRPTAEIRESLRSLARQPEPALADLASGLIPLVDDPEKARAYLHKVYDDPDFQHSAKWDIVPVLAAWAGDDELVLRVWRDNLPVNTMRTIYMWADIFAGARARPGFKQIARDIGFVDYWRKYRWADKCKPLAGDDFECR